MSRGDEKRLQFGLKGLFCLANAVCAMAAFNRIADNEGIGLGNVMLQYLSVGFLTFATTGFALIGVEHVLTKRKFRP